MLCAAVLAGERRDALPLRLERLVLLEHRQVAEMLLLLQTDEELLGRAEFEEGADVLVLREGRVQRDAAQVAAQPRLALVQKVLVRR